MITPSGGELQGFPTARRVICESREATLLSLNGSSGDGWGAEGHDRPAKCGRAASGTPLGIAFSWDTLNHERLDGSGYPNGLKGDAILLEARILAVADVVEAMASHRPYRPGLGVDQAIEEITRYRGSRYDPQVVDACLAVVRSNGMALPA